jgi:hypothetical protein
MSTPLTLLNLAIVGLLLARDLGHRRVNVLAMLRPLLLAAVIVPFVMPGWDMTGNGLVLELVTVATGAGLGLLACAFMRVSVDSSGQAWTDAGVGYAVVWVVIAALRQCIIYGAQHWFTKALGRFLFDNHISVTAFADSIMLFTLTTVIANRLAILARSRARAVAAVATGG